MSDALWPAKNLFNATITIPMINTRNIILLHFELYEIHKLNLFLRYNNTILMTLCHTVDTLYMFLVFWIRLSKWFLIFYEAFISSDQSIDQVCNNPCSHPQPCPAKFFGKCCHKGELMCFVHHEQFNAVMVTFESK